MFERRILDATIVLSIALVTSACELEPNDLTDEDLESDELESDELTDELPTFRGGGGLWIGNGLVSPDVSGVSPTNGLSTKQGLDPNGTLMASAAGITVATYIVECALAANQSISKTRKSDGQTIVIQGLVGLAPAWRDGACDLDCQQWVSACLLARTNASGQSVGIWLSADHPAIGIGHGPDYQHYEASFYGNLFQVNHKDLCRSNAALGGGQLSAYLQQRTCNGQPPEQCGFTDWGACADADRCIFVGGDPTLCAEGNPAGTRYRTISTYVQ